MKSARFARFPIAFSLFLLGVLLALGVSSPAEAYYTPNPNATTGKITGDTPALACQATADWQNANITPSSILYGQWKYVVYYPNLAPDNCSLVCQAIIASPTVACNNTSFDLAIQCTGTDVANSNVDRKSVV